MVHVVGCEVNAVFPSNYCYAIVTASRPTPATQTDQAVASEDRDVLHHHHLSTTSADTNSTCIALGNANINALENLVAVCIGLRCSIER